MNVCDSGSSFDPVSVLKLSWFSIILTWLFIIEPRRPPVKLFAAFFTAFIPADARLDPSFSYQVLSDESSFIVGKNLKLRSNVAIGSICFIQTPSEELKWFMKSCNVVPLLPVAAPIAESIIPPSAPIQNPLIMKSSNQLANSSNNSSSLSKSTWCECEV